MIMTGLSGDSLVKLILFDYKSYWFRFILTSIVCMLTEANIYRSNVPFHWIFVCKMKEHNVMRKLFMIFKRTKYSLVKLILFDYKSYWFRFILTSIVCRHFCADY
jgi:hypothetical protein